MNDFRGYLAEKYQMDEGSDATVVLRVGEKDKAVALKMLKDANIKGSEDKDLYLRFKSPVELRKAMRAIKKSETWVSTTPMTNDSMFRG